MSVAVEAMDIEKSEKYGAKTTVTSADHADAHHVHLAEADEAAAFVAGFHGSIDPEEAKRVLRKIDWNLLPLM